MTDRYILLITSMRQAAHTVTIIFLIANAILLARWSIRYIPARWQTLVRNAFDIYLVTLNLVLFWIAK